LLSITDESNHGKITYLYNNYHDDMIRLAKSRLKKHGCTNYEFDAEDIVQDVLKKRQIFSDAYLESLSYLYQSPDIIHQVILS